VTFMARNGRANELKCPIMRGAVPRKSTKMRTSEKKPRNKKRRSRPSTGKRPRGRPGVNRTQVLQMADQLRAMLPAFWSKLAPQLMAAESPEDVTTAFKTLGSESFRYVPHWSELIWKIVNDRRFPGVRGKAQIEFLSDSLGAQGAVTPRRSREICAKERAKEQHYILRREYFIECTCGYDGPAWKGACPDCGTRQLAEDLSSEDD
jgi:hypothetical protein